MSTGQLQRRCKLQKEISAQNQVSDLLERLLSSLQSALAQRRIMQAGKHSRNGLRLGSDGQQKRRPSESLPQVQITVWEDWWVLAYDLLALWVRVVLGVRTSVSFYFSLRVGRRPDVWDDWKSSFRTTQCLPEVLDSIPGHALPPRNPHNYLCLHGWRFNSNLVPVSLLPQNVLVLDVYRRNPGLQKSKSL